jgi:hypothetical protein
MSLFHRHHVKNRLINGMSCVLCLILLALLVPAAKIHFKEQGLVAGTKKQAGRQGSGQTKQLGLPALFCASA